MSTLNTAQNPLGMTGLAFVEVASPDPAHVDRLLLAFGFSRTNAHPELAVDVWRQNEITFLHTRDPKTMAVAFAGEHGPSIPALGFRVRDPKAAFEEALRRGARAADETAHRRRTIEAPAIVGIGGSLIYFVGDRWPEDASYQKHPSPIIAEPRGFLRIDHLTNNVAAGTLRTWADFYEKIFGFTELRSFDIRGERTGLYSFALQSPCGTFAIPINEGKEEASQIEEYLREYKGPGVQHLAFLTEDILASLDGMRGDGPEGAIPMLDIDPDYYATVFQRVPGVREDHRAIQERAVLVDGDEHGYLLQIFTKNLLGPIFVELIQRRNHRSFGEGNFGALFRSIERDQEKRGVFG